MRKLLLFTITICLSTIATAQHIYDGVALDSTVFTLDDFDSLNHSFGTVPKYTVSIDTTGSHVWRIGKTHKPFFSAGGGDTTFAIMTDTAIAYPKNCNDAFVLKLQTIPLNVIIDFRHKFQSFPNIHGGVVEFSIDSGTTWENVLGDCNADSMTGYALGIHTENFYSHEDTLKSGEPAFTGISASWQYSRLQFFQAIPVRTTGSSGCSFDRNKKLFIRFRFISDSLMSPNDGWIIDDIKIEGDGYYGYVSSVNSNHTLNVSPNPSAGGIFNFPTLGNEKNTQLEITNALGQVLIIVPYGHTIDLSQYPKGLYLYKVVNSTEYYSGRLIVQ